MESDMQAAVRIAEHARIMGMLYALVAASGNGLWAEVRTIMDEIMATDPVVIRSVIMAAIGSFSGQLVINCQLTQNDPNEFLGIIALQNQERLMGALAAIEAGAGGSVAPA